MPSDIVTIDSQVHVYERNNPERPWMGFLEGPDEVTGDDMIEVMDKVGVDGSLLVSSFSLYGYDASYVMDVYESYPGRFGLIKPFDPNSESVSEEIVAWSETPGVVGARLMLGLSSLDVNDPGINRILATGSQVGMPINVMCSGHLPVFRELAIRNPNTQLVVDHLGLPQPHVPPVPQSPFADLEQVIALAELDNVTIKISGACTLSHLPFPYQDIWDPLTKIFNGFGLSRCMWGTDWTRAVDLLTYEQGVEAFRVTDCLSESERRQLMGGSLAQIYKWSPVIP